jgi:hypothetical protein
MDTGAQPMTGPLWPLALAVWLGATPAMAQPQPAGCGERAGPERAAGLDAGKRALRAAALRARLAEMEPEERAALRAERRAAWQARIAAACVEADPWTPKG